MLPCPNCGSTLVRYAGRWWCSRCSATFPAAPLPEPASEGDDE